MQTKPQPALPKCMYRKHGQFYLVKRNKWTPLGPEDNYPAALAEYHRLTSTPVGGIAKVIDEVFADLKKRVKPRPLSRNTLRGYKYSAGVWKRALAEFDITQVRSKDIVRVRNAFRDRPNAANRHLTFIGLVFADAMEKELVDANPCYGIKRLEETKRTVLMTPLEMRQIQAAGSSRTGEQTQIIMDIADLTGQRIGDVLAIRKGDLTEAGILFEQAKTHKKLCVAWNPDLSAAIERALSLPRRVSRLTAPEDQPLFVGRKGQPLSYSAMWQRFERMRDKAGLPHLRPNDTRAKALTRAKAQGVDATALAGHSSPAMTARYLRDRETPIVQAPLRRLIDVKEKTDPKQALK